MFYILVFLLFIPHIYNCLSVTTCGRFYTSHPHLTSVRNGSVPQHILLFTRLIRFPSDPLLFMAIFVVHDDSLSLRFNVRIHSFPLVLFCAYIYDL